MPPRPACWRRPRRRQGATSAWRCSRSTGGNKTEVVALALRTLEERHARSGSLFGAHRGSVTVREGVDLTAPILEDAMDAEHGGPP